MFFKLGVLKKFPNLQISEPCQTSKMEGFAKAVNCF